MSDLPTPPRDIHVTAYADDITIYSSDKNYTIAQQRLQPYLEDVQTWTKANDLKLNASKTMTTLFTPDPAEYRDELSLQLDNTRLPTMRNLKILGLTFDPKLTFNEHIKTSKDKAEKTINILKALTSTHWGKNKETLTNTYKTVTRPILEYAGTIYAPIISDKQLTALQVKENQGLRIATGCTSDTNINHIHDETKILPIEKHLRLHSSQLRQKASHPDHPLHRLTTQPQPPQLKKKTIFNNNQYTLNIDPDPTHAIDENTIKQNMKTIHTTIVQDHLNNRPINKLLNRPPPDIDKKEETLPHSTRRKLSQLRTNKSPLLMTYLHKIDLANHPAANCPLCNDPNHDSLHLFNCPDIPTTLTVWDLWTDPVGVAALLDVWGEKLGGPRAGVWDPVRAHARDGVDTTTTPPPPSRQWRLPFSSVGQGMAGEMKGSMAAPYPLSQKPVVPSGGQCYQVVTSVGQCYQVVASVTKWWPVLPSGDQWYPVVASVTQWYPVLPSGGQCYSVMASGTVSVVSLYLWRSTVYPVLETTKRYPSNVIVRLANRRHWQSACQVLVVWWWSRDLIGDLLLIR